MLTPWWQGDPGHRLTGITGEGSSAPSFHLILCEDPRQLADQGFTCRAGHSRAPRSFVWINERTDPWCHRRGSQRDRLNPLPCAGPSSSPDPNELKPRASRYSTTLHASSKANNGAEQAPASQGPHNPQRHASPTALTPFLACRREGEAALGSHSAAIPQRAPEAARGAGEAARPAPGTVPRAPLRSPGCMRSLVYQMAKPSPFRFFLPCPWILKCTCSSQSRR